MPERPAVPTRPAAPRRPAAPQAGPSASGGVEARTRPASVVPPRSRAPRADEPIESGAGERGEVPAQAPRDFAQVRGADVAGPQAVAASARTALRGATDAAAAGVRRADPSVWAGKVSSAADRVTLRMQERLAERKAVERRVLLRRWGVRAAIMVGVVVVLWAVTQSPLLRFDAASAEVSGTGEYVDAAQVRDAVAEYDGESLAFVDTAELAASIEEIQGVAEVSVVRLWPSTLRITIEPRVPVAAVPVEGGGYAIVDDEAATVSTVEEAPEDLPVVTVPLGEGGDRVLAAVLGVIDELPVDLRARVEGIEAETEDSVSFTLRDGPRVEWGSVEDSATKAQVLQVLLSSSEAASAAVIDVSAPTLPITRDE